MARTQNSARVSAITQSPIRTRPTPVRTIHHGRLRHRNRRYYLRPLNGTFPSPTVKATAQRQARPNFQKLVLANTEQEFPQFSGLPQELRLKIWDMVTDEPRAVIIRLVYGDKGTPTRGFGSPTPVPAALHVCMESREIALKKYELSFAAHDAHYSLDCPARVWFNFEKDMVYFQNRNAGGWHSLMQFRSSIVAKDLERVQFLGTDIERQHYGWPAPWPSLWPAPPLYESWLKAWTGLKVIYRCHESGRVDINRPLKVCTLQGNKERKFVRQYRWTYGKDGRFKGLSTSAAMEKIKSEATTSSGLNGISIPEIGLVTVINY